MFEVMILHQSGHFTSNGLELTESITLIKGTTYSQLCGLALSATSIFHSD